MKIYKNIYIFTFFFKNMEPFANLHVFLVQEPTWRVLRSLSLQDIQSHFHFYKNHSGCHMKNCSETQGWNPRRTVQRLLQKPPEKSQGPKIK